MKQLPRLAQIYVGVMVAGGAALLVICFPRAEFADPVLFGVLLALSSISSVFKVSMPLSPGRSTMSISYAVDFAALLLIGPHETMLVAAASAWTQSTFKIQQRTPMYRKLFSMACLVVAVQAAGWVYAQLGGTVGEFVLLSLPIPLVGAMATYFMMNTAPIALAIALTAQQPVWRVWNENFLWSTPSYFAGAGAAAVAAIIIDQSGRWLVPLAAAPLYLTYRTYKVYLGRIEDEQRHVKEVSDLHLATIEALARAIDAKDQTSQNHIRRVQVYAAGLARAAGMADSEIQAVKTAALLHDIGKLAVPEHILSKPGPLTQEEFRTIRAHPQVGADIIDAVPFPYPVAPLIRSHHERWDGHGYPTGLSGEEIPAGARILAIVDYFDAIMADRPYHEAMDTEQALTLLKQEAGKALDPSLVTRFIEVLPELEIEAELEDRPSRRSRDLAPSAPDGSQPATGLSPEGPAQLTVFEDIARAHREIYALYEIAQAMGGSLGISDTMALITSKLSNLVPFSSCALFLFDEEHDVVRCRFASGTDADLLTQLNVPTGAGVTGWVAQNRRALVNARPNADLEAATPSVAASTQLQSALACPLVLHDRFIGTLAVYHIDPSFYRDDHRRLLDRISEQAAAVINNSILFEQTQEDSLTDQLTGLPNTRFMFMHLSRELARADRLESQTALMVMDLDNFKEINDSHGHHVGDLALCEVATILRAGIRPYDICVRYAGDEFIVVLSGCSEEEAENKRLELQAAVAGLAFEARPGKQIAIGISIGKAVFPHDGESYEALLAVADSRMYQDKSERKRRTRGSARGPDSGPSDGSDVGAPPAASGL
ncbi:MAG: hypothetical protein CL471_17695 [Acidobacteria bacterium]|nr:hypothetical protein [Acidobacteriota bacterium]